MGKYSSFKDHQLITENWRRFLTEQDRQQHADVVKAIKKFFFRWSKATLGMDPGTGVYNPKDAPGQIAQMGAEWMQDPKWRQTVQDVIENELYNVVDTESIATLARKNPDHPAVQSAVANKWHPSRAMMFKLKQ